MADSSEQPQSQGQFRRLSQMTPVPSAAKVRGESGRSRYAILFGGLLAGVLILFLLSAALLTVGQMVAVWNDPLHAEDAQRLAEREIFRLLRDTNLSEAGGEYLGLLGEGYQRVQEEEKSTSRLELIRTAQFEKRNLPIVIFVRPGEQLEVAEIFSFNPHAVTGRSDWDADEGIGFVVTHPEFAP